MSYTIEFAAYTPDGKIYLTGRVRGQGSLETAKRMLMQKHAALRAAGVTVSEPSNDGTVFHTYHPEYGVRYAVVPCTAS